MEYQVEYYQVEYMSRPDEREYIVPFPSLDGAKAFAREMSEKHDGSATVVALAKREDGGMNAVGHIEYVFGTKTRY